MPDPAAETFQRLFTQKGRKVRARRLLRLVFTGLGAGAALGAIVACGVWWLGEGRLAPWAAGTAVVGALAGAAIAVRARWSDLDVALFLDGRLRTDEVITSAIAVVKEDSPRARALRERAAEVLRSDDARAVRPRVFVPAHGLALVGAAAIGVFSVVPSPLAAPAEVPPKGSDRIQKKDVPGLERIEALERAEGLSSADSERLRKLAQDAKQLGADLARGIPRREALSRMGRLRDDIRSEHQRFGDTSERPGLEAAVNALSASEATRRAAKELEEGDVVGFDEEMEKLANSAEAEARERARQALDAAREQAKQRGGERLSQLLERQKRLFEQREASAKALRELARLLEKRMGAEGHDALKGLEQGWDPKSAEQLADALAEALAGLTDEERQRLLENLTRRLEQGERPENADPELLSDLGKQLSGRQGREALQKMLRELARQSSRDAERERALGEADRGGAEAERGLLPLPLAGNGAGRSPGDGAPQPGSPGANGGPGSPGPGGGAERHREAPEPREPKEAPEEFRSKAQARLLPGTPLGTRSLGRAPSRPGETANQVGSGRLGSVGPKEVSAVENSDVPEEYREQVGRYFQP